MLLKLNKQILLNTLEDLNNPIRAVFAVQKLNEGWDVLNLFDIVRLYDGRDNNKGKPGYDIITPLKINSNEILLINRGWIQKDRKGNKNINKVKPDHYQKTDPSKLLKENGIWEKRIPVFLSALRRLRGTHLRMLISQASAIDRGIKGMRKSNVWHELSLLALSITGVHAISPNNIKILIES